MNMTDRFNPANENDPKRKLAYGLIALACVIALGFGLDAASCSRTGTAGDEGGADADSALFSHDHVTHNDDGTVTFTVWMPSSQKTYRGVADMAAGSVSFSE